MAHIGRRHTLGSLANLVGMSTRNLARHFVLETGITPHEFVERARVDAARMRLESSIQPLKSVAYDCGFGTADRMRAFSCVLSFSGESESAVNRSSDMRATSMLPTSAATASRLAVSWIFE